MSAIGSDFVVEESDRMRRCSECNGWIFKGSNALVSRRTGKVKKVVCGENCRLEFDARYWLGIALKNKRR